MEEINPKLLKEGDIYLQILKDFPHRCFIKRRTEDKSIKVVWGVILYDIDLRYKAIRKSDTTYPTWCDFQKAHYYILNEDECTDDGIKRILFELLI